MRRLVAAIVVAALALVLAGCGAKPAATTAPAAPAPAAPAAPAAATPVAGAGAGAGLSSNEATIFAPFPVNSTTPTEVATRIESKQPTLIYFYDSTQETSIENRKIIDKVLQDNRGLVDLVAYDLGEHVQGDAWSPVTVDETFAKDTEYQKAVVMAQTLGVTFTPSIVLTDKQGYIVWEFEGLVDKDFLEREILRASN